MSAIVLADVFELHIARSKLVDAYNEADAAVRLRLCQQGGAAKQLFSQNVEALKAIPASPQYSKADKKRIDHYLRELRDLQAVRCDVVHSSLRSVTLDGRPHALFANVQESATTGLRGLFLTREDLDACAEQLLAIAEAIKPTSSPPARSQVEAGSRRASSDASPRK